MFQAYSAPLGGYHDFQMNHTDPREVHLPVVSSPLVLSQSPSHTFSGPDSYLQFPWLQQAERGGGLLAYHSEKSEKQGRQIPKPDQ